MFFPHSLYIKTNQKCVGDFKRIISLLILKHNLSISMLVCMLFAIKYKVKSAIICIDGIKLTQ